MRRKRKRKRAGCLVGWESVPIFFFFLSIRSVCPSVRLSVWVRPSIHAQTQNRRDKVCLWSEHKKTWLQRSWPWHEQHPWNKGTKQHHTKDRTNTHTHLHTHTCTHTHHISQPYFDYLVFSLFNRTSFFLTSMIQLLVCVCIHRLSISI